MILELFFNLVENGANPFLTLTKEMIRNNPLLEKYRTIPNSAMKIKSCILNLINKKKKFEKKF